MSKTVKVVPGGQQFTVEADETLLEAGLRQDVQFAYGCRSGACGACKATVVSGSVDAGQYQPFALSEKEREEGMVLLCCATALTDIAVEPKVPVKVQTAPKIKTYQATIVSLTYQQDIAIMRMVLPVGETFEFKAGQYIDFLLEGGKKRSFSLANAPHENVIELHIRRHSEGYFSDKVFGALKIGDQLNFEGPLGSFLLDDSEKPIIFVVGGTGFAPAKGMIEWMRHKGIQRSVHLYWGARDLSGFYMENLVEQWTQDLPGFQYIPVLSDEGDEGKWQGRRGKVHQAVLDDLSDLSNYCVYVCGAPPMVEIAHKTFVETRGLPEKAFFSDAFHLAGKME